MISHKHKCIFIHIPKTAGTSINKFFAGTDVELQWKVPNYEILYGWCPKRQIHLQHATANQMLETGLVTQEQWESYYKFTFVRNPWDRAYSDYFWIMKDRNVSGSFEEYINRTGAFEKILTNKSSKDYRGDHLLEQTDFFDFEGIYKPDFIGKFERFSKDINNVMKELNLNKTFDMHENRQTKSLKHYSEFYSKSKKKLVDDYYPNDIKYLGYSYEDKSSFFTKIKELF